MFTSPNMQQFQSNPGNQEIVDLQNTFASLEKRLDELQRCTSSSDAATKMASIENDIKSIQHRMDDAAKSGRQGVNDLSKKFDQLKASAVETKEALEKRLQGFADSIKANTERDKINECYMHLDGGRCEDAAAAADELPIEKVEEIIKKFCNKTDKHNGDTKQVLSEFIEYMKSRDRRNSFKTLVDSLCEYRCYLKI
jgi:flagellar motility protein MotE (MotC chaperone)